ncbi:MAG: carbohydrate kinase family protein [Candidatus Thermoplasmatota archaeon]
MTDLRALADKLTELDPARFHVVTLPDFFLDHFVRVPAWQRTLPSWEAVHARGGGNVPTPGQHFQAGGNAANTALALARLGVRVHLITRTSAFGRVYLEQTLGRSGVDIQHVKGDGALAVTTALEFQDDPPANLMLSDPGSVAQFGPEELDANDWTLLEAADLVLLANWSQNERGTALVSEVARRSRASGTLSMLDTGDPSVRGVGASAGLRDLRERLLPLADLDVYALNENELRQLVARDLKDAPAELKAARELAAVRGSGTLDLHTARSAASFEDGEEHVVPTFRVGPLRVTGAGDAWNAGDILGRLADLGASERLTLANAVAGLYVSGKDALAPRLTDVISFLQTEPETNAIR